MKTSSEYAEMGLRALRRAVLKVHQEAKKNNYKIAYIKDGELKIEVPDEIINEQDLPREQKR
jgi:hypothetical protein